VHSYSTSTALRYEQEVNSLRVLCVTFSYFLGIILDSVWSQDLKIAKILEEEELEKEKGTV
jgi:hypothetical protein